MSLDEGNLRALIERTQAWMLDQEFPRSDTEKMAMRLVEQHIRFAREAKQIGVEL
jgi:hypothetical protein